MRLAPVAVWYFAGSYLAFMSWLSIGVQKLACRNTPYPVNDARNPIYVHAKIMIADDRVLKLESANLNNRSMGYDMECDVIIEALKDNDDLSKGIAAHRKRAARRASRLRAFAARDTTLAFVTAVSIDKIENLRERMGWSHIPFYSLPDGHFSQDFGVEELFGIKVFIRRGEGIFRSYFVNGRGIEEIDPVWSFLDLTLLGRQETWQKVPPGRPQGDPYTWCRLHDPVSAPNPPQPKGDA